MEVTSAGRRSIVRTRVWLRSVSVWVRDRARGSALEARQRGRQQVLAQALQAAGDRGVDHLALDDHAQASDQLGHDAVLEHELLAELRAERRGQAPELGRVEGTRALDGALGRAALVEIAPVEGRA